METDQRAKFNTAGFTRPPQRCLAKATKAQRITILLDKEFLKFQTQTTTHTLYIPNCHDLSICPATDMAKALSEGMFLKDLLLRNLSGINL